MRRLLSNVVGRGRVGDEIDAELQAHVDLLVDEKVAAGVPAAQARREAALELGGAQAVRDRVLDVRAGAWVMQALQDLRYGGRVMRRHLLFAVTAIASLAIGISANTAVFAMADTLLFKPPSGIADPRGLVDIGRTGGRGRGGGVSSFSQLSYPNYLDLRKRVTGVTPLYAYQPVAEALTVRIDGSVERALTTFVSGNYFSALGVRPAIGRLFSEGDAGRPDTIASIVLSHQFWLRRFNGAADVIGRTVDISGHPFTIAGVAPAGFRGTTVLFADLWLTTDAVSLARSDAAAQLENRAMPWVFLGGRLAPDRTIAAAAAELDAVAQSLANDYPADNAGLRFRVLPSTPVPGNLLPVGPFIVLLSFIVLAVLAIACANVAGVLLARAATRQREIAVRLAIGASRARIMRQLLTETLILVGLGGGIAIVLARVMTRTLMAALPALPIPVDLNLVLDQRALGFTFAVSVVTVFITGIAPAWQASRTTLATLLKDEGRGSSSRTRLRHAFVAGQVALSLLLIVIAGLFMRGLERGAAIDLGFDSHGVDLINLDLSGGAAPDQQRLQTLMQRIRAISGVQQAAVAMTGAPIGDGAGAGLLTAPGVVPPDNAEAFEGDWNAIDAGYFDTLRVPLIAGRAFTDSDVSGAAPVAIVGSAVAARFWPGRSAIGQMITLQSGRLAGPASLRGERHTMTVVGVARDLRYFGPTDDSVHWHVYVPLYQQFSPKVTVAVRPAPGAAAMPDVRLAVASTYPQLPPVSIRTLDDTISIALVPQRIAFAVSATLGGVGLVLAMLGIYGVTGYGVARRTREFGIRLSLGATPSTIVTAVVGHGLLIAGAGAAIGLLAAAALARLLQRFLFGVSPFDPVTIAATTALFIVVTLAACLVPAVRVTRINVVDALRAE